MMTDLPDRWGEYLSLQEKLSRTHRVDDYSSGLEEGMNRILAEEPPTVDEVDRTVKSASRKERYRQRLRNIYLKAEEPTANLDGVVDARRRLHLVRKHVSSEDWALLSEVGVGREYEDIAADRKTAPGTVRARVLRLRRTLIALAS
jgi:hypothetical protein